MCVCDGQTQPTRRKERDEWGTPAIAWFRQFTPCLTSFAERHGMLAAYALLVILVWPSVYPVGM